ncbi:hypothetical protein SLS58_001888 [Diplodia intermedia]|uniref:Uncharacterized protein n=1 Tax=Diplodia intermedia TaxID=856260 RepID=A0ABR3U052_9PEZI
MSRLYADFETWKLSHDYLASRYVYVLQKTYGDQLSLGSLSGGDLSLARALRDIGHKLDFEILLAKIEKRRHGHVEVDAYGYDYESDHFDEVHEMDEILEEEISLLSVFDLSGRLLVKDVDIEKKEVLQKRWEDDDAASESNLEDIGYNPTATHSFRGTALVMMSHDEATIFLARGGCSTAVMLDHLREQQPNNPDDPKGFQDFLLHKSFDGKSFESVMKACISLKRTELFLSVARPLKFPLSSQVLSDLSSWIWQAGFQHFEAGLEKLIPDEAVVFETHDLLQALLSCRSSEQPQLNPGMDTSFFDFVERKTNEVLSKASSLYLKDATALVDILKTTRHFEQTAGNVAPKFGGMVPMVPVDPIMNRYEDGRIILPFMRLLPEKMQGDGSKTLAAFPKIRELYRNFVTVYFDRAVGKEPAFDWSRPGATPSTDDKPLFVADRAHLSAFLHDPHYVEGRFPLAAYRQRKLMNHVPPNAGCTSSLATGCLTVRKGKGAWETERKRWAENCKSFVSGIRWLGGVVDLEAVLDPETYGSTVLRPEQRASEEPVAEGPDDREQVPPHMVLQHPTLQA